MAIADSESGMENDFPEVLLLGHSQHPSLSIVNFEEQIVRAQALDRYNTH